MLIGSRGYGVLKRVPITMIEEWFGLGIQPLIRNMEVDPVLVLVAVVRAAEMDWAALPGKEWFPHDFAQEMLKLRQDRGPTADQNGEEDEEGERDSQIVVQSVYHAASATRRKLFLYA